MPTPKQRAQAWATSIWGSAGLATRATVKHDGIAHVLIGEVEEGFLGRMLRYYGRGRDWTEALEDAMLRWPALGHRGLTNGFK